MSASDFSASVSAYLVEEAALALTHMASKDQFVEQAGKGTLAFQRGRIRMRRHVNDQKETKLTIVRSKPRHFDIPTVTNACSQQCCPMLLCPGPGDWLLP